MQYISIKETAKKWGLSSRRVQALCSANRINGATRIGKTWAIPIDAPRPDDARLKLDTDNQQYQPSVRIDRAWAMPSKNTFNIKPIHQLILEEKTDGCWVDPFANTNKLATITNDLNKAFDTDYHLDALDFLKIFKDSSIDGVLYDPPFSPRQVSECYNDVGYDVTWDTTKASFWGNHKKEISRIVKIGGKVISFGWNSGGIGMKYGFEIQRILLVSHGGWHNDTICTVEIKTHEPDKSVFEPTIATQKPKKEFNMSEMDNQLIKCLKKLPSNFWDFENADTREYTHGIHSYPAMMINPISRNIIKLIQPLRPIKALFDPFCGSGTVLVEGQVAGIPKVCGNDINPLALLLSKVKTTRIDVSILSQALEQFGHGLDKEYEKYEKNIISVNNDIEKLHYDLTAKTGWGDDAANILRKYCENNSIDLCIPDFKNIGYWFKPRAILELTIIKNEILKIKDCDIKDFLLVALSETIRLVSNRRNGEFKMFRMTNDKVKHFELDVKQEFLKLLNRNVNKFVSYMEELDNRQITTEVKLYNDNVCNLTDVPDGEFDLIITSPPYGDSRTTVAYGEYSRLSLQWLNIFNMPSENVMKIDKSLMGGTKFRNGFEFDIPSNTLKESLIKIKDIDLERAGDVYSFYKDLEKSIEEISKKTRKGGYQFWVVGNRTVKNENLKTDVILSEISQSYGLKPIYTISRNIHNKVMPSKNSPTNISGQTNSTMCNEHIIVLKKAE